MIDYCNACLEKQQDLLYYSSTKNDDDGVGTSKK